MSITGELETMPLPDIVQFLGLGQKTGVLTVEAGLRRKQLVFEKGEAVFCSSGSAKEFLGQHLLARTRLTAAQLEEAFRAQERTGRRLGEILVASGGLSAAELQTVLTHKILDSMYELFTWRSGTFSFREGAAPADLVPVRAPVGWQDLVMEGARRQDELEQILRVVPGRDARFRVLHERLPEGFPKASGDRKLLSLIDDGRTVGEIYARFHASDFEIASRIAGLVGEGYLKAEASEESERTEGVHPDAGAIVASCRDLARRGHLGEAYETLADAIEATGPVPEILEALKEVGGSLRRAFDEMGGLEVVPRLAVPMEKVTTLPLDSRQAFVVSRLDARWSVRSIVQLCPFDESEVLATLERLLQRGLVELDAPAACPR